MTPIPRSNNQRVIQMKRILVLLLAAAFFTAAAWYRPGDSAHAMGMVSVDGGRARHPVQLPAGGHRYTLVVTGSILPPYQGDARVAVEGEPPLSFDVYGSDPIVDLGLRRRPYFREQTLTGLRPRDRFTLWLVLRQPTGPGLSGRYHITFSDVATGRSVLRIPVLFGGEEGRHHEG